MAMAAQVPNEVVSGYEALSSSVQKVLREKDLAEVLRAICEEVCRVLGADRSLVARMPTAEREVPLVLWARGVPAWYLERVKRARRFPLLEDVVETDEVVIVQEPYRDPRMFDSWAVKEAGHETICVVPLVVGGEPFGGLYVYHLIPKEYTPQERVLAAAFGGLASVAIEKAHLLEEVGRRTSRLEIVNRITLAIGSILNPSDLFRTIVREIRKAVPCERCVIATFDWGGDELRYWHVESDVDMPPRTREEARDAAGWFRKEIYEAKRIQAIPDFQMEGLPWVRRLSERGFRSIVAIPILKEDTCIAHLSLISTKVNGFRQDQIDLLKLIAPHLASAIQSSTLLRKVESRSIRLSFLNALALEIGRNLEMGVVLDQVVRGAVDLLKGDHARIFLVDETTMGLEFVASHGPLPEAKDWIPGLKVGESVTGRIALTGEPAILPDVRVEPTWKSIGWAKRLGLHSYIGQPLRAGEKIIGVLNCMSRQPDFFTPEDLQFLGSLAAHAAAIIQKSRVLAETRERAAHLEIVGNIAKAVGSTLEPEELFRTIVREIRKAVPCERCAISRFHRNQYELLHVDSDVVVEARDRNDASDLREWLQGVYEESRIKVIPDLSEDPSPRSRQMAMAGLRSVIVIPILLDGRCMAHFGLSSKKVNAFTPQHQKLLTSIANHLGTAIRNATLHQAAEEHAERMAILGETNKIIGGNLQISEVLGAIVRSSRDLLRADHVRLYLLDEEGRKLVLRASAGLIPMPPGLSPSLGISESVTGRVFQSGESLIVPDTHADPLWAPPAWEWVPLEKIRSRISSPLVYEGKAIGVINCTSGKVNFFTQDDLSFLGAVASQAAVAIRNARLHEEAERSRDFFRSVVKDNANPILVTDRDRRIVIWNAAAEKLYGYSEREVIGRTPKEFLRPPEFSAVFEPKILEALRGGETVHIDDTRMRAKDGRLIPVSITISPVKNKDGETVALAGIHRDLTEQKRAEKKLGLYAEKLAGLSRSLLRAQEMERRKIARELHDEVGQDLTALKLSLQALGSSKRGTSFQEKRAESERIVEKVLKKIRNLSFSLHASVLDDLGLKSALRWYLDRQSRHAGINAELVMDSVDDRLPREVEIACFRVSQEALTNVVRHAQASRVKVELRLDGSTLNLTVADDGVGFVFPFDEEASSPGESFGLLGMRERARLVGGRVEIDSAPGRGTTLRAYFPLTDSSSPAD